MTRRRTATVGLLAALALPLAGCGVLPGDDPTPTAPDPGRQLTEQEARAALPDVPSGAEARTPDGQPTELESQPADCLDVLRAGPAADALRSSEAVRAERAWSSSSPRGSTVSVRIVSYDRPIGSTVLDRAGAAMSGCDSFDYRGVGADGADFELHLLADPRSVRPLGEQTFAARITPVAQIGGTTRKVFIDQLIVRSGHTLVSLVHSHWEEPTTHDVLEELADEVLESLSA